MTETEFRAFIAGLGQVWTVTDIEFCLIDARPPAPQVILFSAVLDDDLYITTLESDTESEFQPLLAYLRREWRDAGKYESSEGAIAREYRNPLAKGLQND